MKKERTEKEHSMLIFSHLLVGVRMVSFRLKEFAPIHAPELLLKLTIARVLNKKRFQLKRTHAALISRLIVGILG